MKQDDAQKPYRLKHLVSAMETGSRNDVEYVEGEVVPSIGGEHVSEGKVNFTGNKYITKEYYFGMSKGRLEDNDILLVKDGATIGKSGYAGKIDKQMAINEHLYRIQSNKKICDQKYLYYIFNSDDILSQIYLDIRGSAQGGLNVGFVSKIRVNLPKMDTQIRTVLFLDKKSQLIGKIIEKKQKLTNLLSEKRSALITHTVTKGLDPKTKMKPSGIEWVKEIPVNWKVVPLFSKAKENLNKNTKLNNTNLLSLSYGKIIQKDIKSDFGLLPESFNTYQIIKNGYIVLRLTDLQNDHKSLRVGLVNGESGIITSAYTSIFFINGINPTYGYYLLHAYDISKVFYGMGGGVRQSIDYKQVKKLPFILPSFIEQNSIVDYLESKTELIDSIVSKTEKSISELQEFRSSLIYHAVTGKIKI